MEKPRLTYANVVATLALFVALSGGAYAAAQLPKNSVGSGQIKSNAVKSAEVKNGALKKEDLAPGTIPTVPVFRGNVATGQAPGTVIFADPVVGISLQLASGAKVTVVNTHTTVPDVVQLDGLLVVGGTTGSVADTDMGHLSYGLFGTTFITIGHGSGASPPYLHFTATRVSTRAMVVIACATNTSAGYISCTGVR